MSFRAEAIEQVLLGELVPYARNARTHSAAQVAQIAASIKEFGFTNPVLIDADGGIIAGHGRVLAAAKLKMESAPCVRLGHLTETQRRAYVLADNKLALNAGWDAELLSVELDELRDAGVDLALLGFARVELNELLGTPNTGPAPDITPAVAGVVISRPGDFWTLGRHRIGCGDSRDAVALAQLIPAGTRAQLLHADPPYGMGKESDGVANDNLYAGKLDKFQTEWWRAWRPFLADNGSAYVWGVAEDLWRWWFAWLGSSERLTLRNEIVWDKGNGSGMLSETHRQFATATERCLFFMVGEQGFGNVNTADYWEGFEPIRGYLEEQAKAMGWGAREVNKLTGVGMFSHWFTKAQWTMIGAKHYATLQEAAGSRAFTMPYAELRKLYDGGPDSRGDLAAKREYYGTRAYFDNLHDRMTDVWECGRVLGEERFGHATPKPVALTSRAIKSSAPEGGAVLEPFAGTGTTLIAAEQTGRACYTMELEPAYVDVVVRRWQGLTGQRAVLDGTGQTFEEVAGARIES